MNEEGKRRNYDYTSTQRAARRAAHLHQVAQANGYETWYKLETAVINGAVLTVGQAGAQAVEADDPDALAADIRRFYDSVDAWKQKFGE